MYTDYEIMRGQSSDYVMRKGLGVLKGTMCPHFNEREKDFLPTVKNQKIPLSYGVENDCAVEFTNGVITKVISSGGKAYKICCVNDSVTQEELL
jgi:hypothetical protein